MPEMAECVVPERPNHHQEHKNQGDERSKKASIYFDIFYEKISGNQAADNYHKKGRNQEAAGRAQFEHGDSATHHNHLCPILIISSGLQLVLSAPWTSNLLLVPTAFLQESARVSFFL